MIITCPNCQTRYRVASDALSAAGRQVQCAACSELWYATPSFPAPRPDPEPGADELAFADDNDALFSDADEALLDAQFLAAQPEPVLAQNAPASLDTNARTKALAKRRQGLLAKLPIARFRRLFRIALVLVAMALIASALVWRTQLVATYPQLDGLYRLVGIGTNVVGLDFIDINTLRTTRDGNSVIIVNAKISNITNQLAYVPSVLVSLLDEADRVVYEWTVTPAARSILPGDVLAIDTQLTAPPQGVTNVRLSFVEGRPAQTAPRS